MSWQASRNNGDSHVKYGSYVLGQGLSKSLNADRYQDGAGRGGARGDKADDWRLPQMSSPRMRLLTPRTEEVAYKPADASSVRLPAPRHALPGADVGGRQAAPVKRRAQGGASQTKWPVWHLRTEPGQAETTPSAASRTAEPPSKPRDHPPRPGTVAGAGQTTATGSQPSADPSSPSKGAVFTEGDLRRRQRDRQSRRRANAAATIQAYLRCASLHNSFVEIMKQRHSAAHTIQRQWDRHRSAKQVQLKKQEARRVHDAAARIQASWRGFRARRSLGLAPRPSSKLKTSNDHHHDSDDPHDDVVPTQPDDIKSLPGKSADIILMEDVAQQQDSTSAASVAVEESTQHQDASDVARTAVEDSAEPQDVRAVAQTALMEALSDPDIEPSATDLRVTAKSALADCLAEVTTARTQAGQALEEALLLHHDAEEGDEEDPRQLAQVGLVSALSEVQDARALAQETFDILHTGAEDVRILASRAIESALANILLEEATKTDFARSALSAALSTADQEHDALGLLVQSALELAVLQVSEAEGRECQKQAQGALHEALEDEGEYKAMGILAQDALSCALGEQEFLMRDEMEKPSKSGQHVSIREDAHVGGARRPSLGEEIAADAAAALLQSALQKADASSSRRSSSTSDTSCVNPDIRGSGIMQAALAGLLVEHDLEVHMEESSTEGDAWNFLDMCSVTDSSAISCELVDAGES